MDIRRTTLFAMVTLARLLPLHAASLPSQLPKSFCSTACNTNGQTIQGLTQYTNLTYHPWPQVPIRVKLPSTDYTLFITSVSAYTDRPPIKTIEFQDFIAEFRENLEQRYPSLLPHKAGQSQIDAISSTSWRIELEKDILVPEMSTQVALTCLEALQGLVKRYGPSSVTGYLTVKPYYMLQGTLVDLRITPLASAS